MGEFFRLFNAGEYFAAHEALEAVWKARATPDRDFYQGLIQVAVALEHARRGNLPGARGVLESARRRLQPFFPLHRDLDLAGLLEGAARHLESPHDHPAPRLPEEADSDLG